MKLLIILIATLVWRPLIVAVEGSKEKPHAEHNHEEHDEHEDEKNTEGKGHEHKEHESEKHEEHGEKKHDEHKDAKHSEHAGEKHTEHEGEKDEEHGDEHGEGESRVGPGKGVEAASEELGIKLSSQAVKSFEIETIRVSALPVTIPKTALLFLADEVEVFRLRDGFFKRIDFKKISDTPLRISSSDLKVGDSVVTSGVGFIRIAEVAAFGGAPEGHSH